ncbi:flagellum-specific peptidoglycan hydrolase FlgJ [Mucilaginibacter gracilis]|uniref:Peptidoglycan hydrolase n=1 Tax=Mucilaginibacter gracilis TaxID=423350 RepID=A0A495IXN3_9SPHI|nr:glucosaminidase domain-containing protein [Mucilaginibacter gracilis]RKR81141.1 flagellum-specific peptidoglycan hydrolase FlgJ [Mucilaginibacter gracilis]
MRKITCALFVIITLASCSARKKVATISSGQARHNNQEIQKEHQAAIGNYPTYTADQYIQRFKKIAIQEMNAYGVPASITLAQGLFESGNGNGDLARIANNHFGIKCTSDWKGKSYYKNDDQVNDCFRVYDNPEDSFRDHSNFLKRKRYASLFELDKNDYMGWANGLKAAGYATNPKYPQLLIAVIEKYNLDQYDRPEGEVQKIKREDRVLTQINQNIGKSVKDSIISQTPTDKLYTVKQGDTLYNISKRFGLTVDELKALNNMADNNIKLGQKLVVVK